MSGGVDSSVSALLLKEQGYAVTGVFIKVWQPDWIECSWRDERLEAMRAAAHLGIDLVTLDLEKEYKQGVIDYMIREYAAGRTPNPDVMCNREVKFGAFWQWAQAQGADLIATGHYAQNLGGKLLAGADKNKDQSYFLWTLTQDDLAHALFPVGGLTKDKVRGLARRGGLPNADKKDSQGLCFIGKVDVKEFLSHYIKTEKGDVLNERGEVIGWHPGALLLTIGERHGFTITKKTPEDRPYYIVSKDPAKNTITVSSDRKPPSSGRTAMLSGTNWISRAPGDGERILARTRYREELKQATVIRASTGSRAEIAFDEPHASITPGQSLVVYKGEECLGGGIIV